MLFNSFEFLCIFFPLVTGLYFVLPKGQRWVLLLLASCWFYMAFVPAYILILAFTIVVDYYAAIWMEESGGRKRIWIFAASILANTGVQATDPGGVRDITVPETGILLPRHARPEVLPRTSTLSA